MIIFPIQEPPGRIASPGTKLPRNRFLPEEPVCPAPGLNMLAQILACHLKFPPERGPHRQGGLNLFAAGIYALNLGHGIGK